MVQHPVAAMNLNSLMSLSMILNILTPPLWFYKKPDRNTAGHFYEKTTAGHYWGDTNCKIIFIEIGL